MLAVNSKLWSFLMGCVVAGSFVWFIDLGNAFPLLTIFANASPDVLQYYPEIATAIMSLIFTLFILVVMKKIFNISSNDHTFWFAIPSLISIVLTAFTAAIMIIPMLFASLPALGVIGISALIHRFSHANLSQHNNMTMTHNH
jgi:hypothetical protein